MISLAIIQARMNSTRFAGKAFADIAGQPMLRRVCDQVWLSNQIDSVIVGTTPLPEDNEIEHAVKLWGYPCARPVRDPHDVLARFYDIAQMSPDATHIVRITGDCPLVCPDLIDTQLHTLAECPSISFMSNAAPRYRTVPDGCDTETFTVALLRKWHETVTSPVHREHVTQWAYDNERFYAQSAGALPDVRTPVKWSVDEPKDLAFPCYVYERCSVPTYPDLLQLWEEFSHRPQEANT